MVIDFATCFLFGKDLVGEDDDDNDENDVVDGDDGDDDDDKMVKILAVVIIIWMLSRRCHLVRFAVLMLEKRKF